MKWDPDLHVVFHGSTLSMSLKSKISLYSLNDELFMVFRC